MRSRFIPVILSNAEQALVSLLPRALAEAPPTLRTFDALSRCFRVRGCASFFLDCRPSSLLLNLQRSATAHAHFLPLAVDADLVTSRAGPFFDSVACGDFKGAAAIANSSSRQARPQRELLEDFHYVNFLMQRFFRGEDGSSEPLTHFEEVLDGQPSARLDLSRALLERDGPGFASALRVLLDEHERWYAVGLLRGKIPEEVWAIEGSLCIEGLALLRLALGSGMSIDVGQSFPLVPSLLIDAPALPSDADAWKTL